VYPVPTVAQLAFFSGRPESSYSGYAVAALTLATLEFTFRTEITDPSQFTGYNNITAADAQLLATNGICAYADYLYLRQPYAQVIASPMQNENVGSYAYSKPLQEMARNAAALEVTGEQTGVPLFDRAVQVLSLRTLAGGVSSGAVRVFDLKADDCYPERSMPVRLLTDPDTGTLYVSGPADRDELDWPFFDINAESFPVDPGIG
jgi:hypothetical protein